MVTETELEILDQIDALNEKIRQTEVYRHYCKYRTLLEQDEEVAGLIDQFTRLKMDFEEVQRFGKYHPDFSTKRREINQFKKKLDMHPVIMEYRRAEYQLQEMLDEVLYHVSISVSSHVNVVSSNPFFSVSSDSGGCATGGSCGCQSAG
ncbi:YlbF family regulator [Salinicoccus sp. RF5]|uniref:YlbF family regulator n=1 Tax=Salinicoccus sp. RF5 TaxID=2748874 RepID=UPI001E2E8384|nr:YlbF family regulator [Salinicoccus sp. RF5]MCC4722147.1 YlbF family regulator [Salinicoccus sp. RF5]